MTNYNEGLFYFRRAETNFNNRNYDKAIALFTKAIDNFKSIVDIRDKLSKCYAARGYCYFELGDFNNAIHDLEDY